MINKGKEYQHGRKMLLVVLSNILPSIHIFPLFKGSKIISTKNIGGVWLECETLIVLNHTELHRRNCER